MSSPFVFVSRTGIFLAAQNILAENLNIKAALFFHWIKVDASPDRLALVKSASKPSVEGCAEQTSQHSPTAARDQQASQRLQVAENEV